VTSFAAPVGFHVLDRATWATIGRGRAPEEAAPPPDTPVDRDEWLEIYVPLAHVIGLHVDNRLELRRHLAAAGMPGGAVGPFIIGLAGSVAAGKTVFARTLAALLSARADRPRVRVLSTDGFLYPNAVLEPRGRVGFKGFPDTYDNGLFERVLGGLALADPSVGVPAYSHELYDVVGPPVPIGPADIVILEGVNALGQPADYCSLRLFLDAEESDVRAWYVARFLALIEDARSRPTSFFAQWTELSPPEAHSLAVAVWEAVNLVNLNEHILPTRWRADFVLRKGADHRVRAVAVRNR
jgi:type I pantothenate kinase